MGDWKVIGVNEQTNSKANSSADVCDSSPFQEEMKRVGSIVDHPGESWARGAAERLRSVS